MSNNISRRRFLIGGSLAATAALASFYVGQVEEFGKLTLREPPDYDRVLYADESRGFLLSLDYTYDDATDAFPGRAYMSWRDYMVWKGLVSAPDKLSLSTFKLARNEYGITPKQLDEAIDPERMEEAWRFYLGPEAETYFYLEGLDLLEGLPEDQATHNALSTVQDDGDLSFSHDFQQGRTVHCSDLTSVALLQEKLIELGELIKVELV